MSKDQVNHPEHYGGEADPYECIKVIEAWRLGFALGNCVKYLARAGKKPAAAGTTLAAAALLDLKKARWYLDREIANREAEEEAAP